MTVKQLTRIVVRRLFQAILTAWVLATLCFGLVQVMPGDTAFRIAAAQVGIDRVNAEFTKRARIEALLDKPILYRYLHWMQGLLRADLGRSVVSQRPVFEELADYGATTVWLGMAGWILSYLIALPLGIVAGLNPERFVDRTTSVFAATLASLPTFLVGIGLISLFSLTLRWLPPAGSSTQLHFVLPAVCLALGLAAFSVRVVRNAVREIRGAFYITYAQIRGFTARTALRRHAPRNAAIPIVTYAALQFAFIVDGFVVIEMLFNVPGIGLLLVESLLARDLPVVLGATLFIGFTYALISLLADLACLGIDPRLSEKRPQ